MSVRTIEKDFIESVSTEIELLDYGNDRFFVSTPFHFNDGDQLVIVLKKMGNRWVLSDEAHTFMHLTYYMDEKALGSESRLKIISKALSMFQVKDYNGELVMDITDGDYGEALFDSIQALLKIIDVTYLSRDSVKSTFKDDFRTLLLQKVEADRMIFDWHHPNDKDSIYRVDCRINGLPVPLFVFALNSESKTQAAALTLHQLKLWDVKFQSLGIFEKKTTRDVLLRFNDICQTHFTNINTNSDGIIKYLQDYTSGSISVL